MPKASSHVHAAIRPWTGNTVMTITSMKCSVHTCDLRAPDSERWRYWAIIRSGMGEKDQDLAGTL